MKSKLIAFIIAAAVLPGVAFSQAPQAAAPPPAATATPTAPEPPQTPATAQNDDKDRDERREKVPVTFLGVETSAVPRVVSEQLGLTRGFGLVVDYVVPDGPAAAAGVQQNDILKLLNDQILVEPEQLGKLVRSFPEGTNVTLTVLRRGVETKLNVRLGSRQVPKARNDRAFEMHWGHGKGFGDAGDLVDAAAIASAVAGPDMEALKEMRRDMGRGISREVRERIRREAREAREAARDARREAARSVREARRAAREFQMMQQDHDGVRTTRIDLGRAEIVLHDSQGELKVSRIDGKKILTAKDPQGRLQFSGPVDTPEDVAKIPPEVRQRYDKLEQRDLPAVAPVPPIPPTPPAPPQPEDMPDDEENEPGSDAAAAGLQTVLQMVNGPGAEGTAVRPLLSGI